MLIFWKLAYGEDSPLYSKDYSQNVVPTPLNQTYIPTKNDKLINVAMGTILLLAFVVSTTLNYIVYNFNNQKRPNIANFLFKSLSIVDFMTTIYAPWLYASMMFSTKVLPCSNQVATFTRQFVCILGCISQVITWMLAITRFVRVILPFTLANKKMILSYVVLYGTLMTVNSSVSIVIQMSGHDTSQAAIWVMRSIVHLCFLMNLAHCSTGIICSVVTSIYLVRCTKAHALSTKTKGSFLHDKQTINVLIKQRLRGCVTILLMNIPYLLNIAFIVYVNVKPGQMSFHDILFGFLPIISSTINPVIVASRNYWKIRMQILNKKTRPSVIQRRCESIGFITDTHTSPGRQTISLSKRNTGKFQSRNVQDSLRRENVIWNAYTERKSISQDNK